MSDEDPQEGAPLPADTSVLRLPKRPLDFQPSRWRPTWQHFEPSSTEKTIAKATGKPVRVSVWDERLTNPTQAREIRAMGAQIVILRLPLHKLKQIADEADERLQAVYDPLDVQKRHLPGALGHAGIEGLEKGTRASVPWKQLLSRIADGCSIVD